MDGRDLADDSGGFGLQVGIAEHEQRLVLFDFGRMLDMNLIDNSRRAGKHLAALLGPDFRGTGDREFRPHQAERAMIPARNSKLSRMPGRKIVPKKLRPPPHDLTQGASLRSTAAWSATEDRWASCSPRARQAS